MKYINKKTEPSELSHKRSDLERTPNCECDLYGRHLDSSTRKLIFEFCLIEQQGLCAYTGMTVSSDNGHVEHIVPRSVSCPKNPPANFVPRPFQTIDWKNLVVCVPKNPSGSHYGAGKKDHWPQDSEVGDFVSPLDDGCEQRFRYGKQGTVKPKNEGDQAASKTIEKLGLDHSYLIEARKQILEVDQRVKEPAKRKRLLATLDDANATNLPQFAMQRSQILKRLWAGTL